MATVAEAPPSASSVFSLYIPVTHLYVIVAGVHRFESERYSRFLSNISILMKDTVLKHGFWHQTRSTSYVFIYYFVGEDHQIHHMPFCDTDVPVSLANRNDNSVDTDVSRTIRIRLWVHCHRHVLFPTTPFSLALTVADDSIVSPMAITAVGESLVNQRRNVTHPRQSSPAGLK